MKSSLRCKINDPYNEHEWIPFDKYEHSYLFNGYAYEYTTDEIERSLNYLKNKEIYSLIESEMVKDWQDAIKLRDTPLIPERYKHCIRIAYLINQLINGGEIRPVDIDTFSKALSHLEGHHRLLALKYLGFTEFPVYLSGSCDILEEIFNIS